MRLSDAESMDNVWPISDFFDNGQEGFKLNIHVHIVDIGQCPHLAGAEFGLWKFLTLNAYSQWYLKSNALKTSAVKVTKQVLATCMSLNSLYFVSVKSH